MDQKNSNDTVTRLRMIAIVALIVLLLTLLLKTVVSRDRRELKKNISLPEPASSEEQQPVDRINKQELLSNFIYYELDTELVDSALLSTGGTEAYRAELQPVYNALFSRDGLQIASLADSRLTCAAAAVDPLSEMLNGFYEETGLRTIMILSAYIPTDQPEPQGYYDEYGNYYEYPYDSVMPEETASGLCFKLGLYDEDHGKTDFTGEGNYAWFAENAYRYGFVLRYPEDKQFFTGKPYDPSVYRYVGKQNAAVLHENSICLEELKSYMINKDYDNALLLPIGETPTLIYSVPYPWAGTARIKLPDSSDGETVPFSAYACDELIIVCAEPQQFIYYDSNNSDSNSE